MPRYELTRRRPEQDDFRLTFGRITGSLALFRPLPIRLSRPAKNCFTPVDHNHGSQVGEFGMEDELNERDERDELDEFDELDELDSLREKSTRTSSIYDDIEAEEQSEKKGFLAGLTPQQRLVLAFLLFIDIIALACGALVVLGVITLF